ncbi:hypothetical protein GCM10025868_18180 [Angustibacter aerolatus]|uniref:Uncharacterized protein n=1 Tax=Angustibacter aerolatus TaxID=1162965 RepID=A0ABQ6JGN7_9ACTN|nr:twin-arginine translocation signal domain-containing protein [Angustibacter aerolatus]GMA86568.1 hypothetical protein GCM10025868_18180 [Angustibacter aerolatus]
MPDARRTNTALLWLLVSALLTGAAVDGFGTPLVGRWVVVGHGVAGIGLLVLSRPKHRVVRRSLDRPRRRPGSRWSLVLLALVLLTVATGLLQASGLVERLGPVTVLQVHVVGGVAIVPVAAQHWLRRRRQRVVRTTQAGVRSGLPTRRGLLQGTAIAVAAGGAWAGWEGGLAVAGAPGAARRFTGSHETGSGDPGQPVTQW